MTATSALRVIRRGPVSVVWQPRRTAVTWVLAVTVAAAVVMHVAIAGDPLSPGEVIAGLTGIGDPRLQLVVGEFRAPRTVAAVLAGACLAASGALTQTLARNPLASPDLLGVTAGASLAAVAVLVAAGGGAAGLSGVAATVGMPAAAFGGALLAGAVVALFAWRRGLDATRLVLVGLGVAALAGGLTSWLLTLGDVSSAAQALTWMSGSLNGEDWPPLVIPLVSGGMLLAAALLLSRPLGIAAFGDETAIGLGLPLARVRLASLTVAVLLAAVGTVVAGPLVFVALASPQVARLLTRSPVPPVLASALTGVAFVLVADQLSAHALSVPLPVGIGTALLGAPYLIALIVAAQRRTS